MTTAFKAGPLINTEHRNPAFEMKTNTLSYRIAVADGISVVVNQFLKINKRGGSNKHGGKCMEICFYSLHTETIPRKLINVADQIRAWRTDIFAK